MVSAIIKVQEDIVDRDSAERLKQDFDRAFSQGTRYLVLDLGETHEIDMHGVAKILFMYKKLLNVGGRLDVLNNLKEKTRKMFDELLLTELLVQNKDGYKGYRRGQSL